MPKDRIIQLKARFTENENLNHNEVIKKFNDLTKPFGIGSVKTKDFEKALEIEDDDLPF